MKKLIIVLMIIQVVLFCIGVYFLIEGYIERGIYLIAINSLFFLVNIYNLKQQQKLID